MAQDDINMENQCELCERILKASTTEHHLIPRKCHKNRWFQKNFTRQQMAVTMPTCRDCHKAIHRLIPDEKALGKHFNTRTKLLEHPEIAKFVRWVRKQR